MEEQRSRITQREHHERELDHQNLFCEERTDPIENEEDVSATGSKKEQEKEKETEIEAECNRSLSSECEYLLSHTNTDTTTCHPKAIYRSCATHYSRFFYTHLLATLHYFYLADADQRSG